MKRVCINRLRMEARHLAQTVDYLEQQDDVMQELFDVLFKICCYESSAPSPVDQTQTSAGRPVGEMRQNNRQQTTVHTETNQNESRDPRGHQS